MTTLKILYEKGKVRIEKDLNVERLIKSIRDLKIFMKSNITKEDRFKNQYHKNNVIDVDIPPVEGPPEKKKNEEEINKENNEISIKSKNENSIIFELQETPFIESNFTYPAFVKGEFGKHTR